MRIHYFQHVAFEGLALLKDWAISRQHSLAATHFFEEHYVLPSIDDFDMLILLGGPMSVHDIQAYPWLEDERLVVQSAIDANKYVLGICLGAQLIAQCLGAKVFANPQKEIGWFPLAFSDPVLGHDLLKGINHSLCVLHWHGETFELPQQAKHLASSAVCQNQGFLYRDKVLALQFHLEMDVEAVKKIVKECGHELQINETIQSDTEILEQAKNSHLQQAQFLLLDNWVLLAN